MGTVPLPYSPIAGDDATQARVLTWADTCAYMLGSATSTGSRKPVCVLRQTVAQSLTTAVDAAITFDVEDVDYDNGHSTVTNTSRYTAATAGWHDVFYIANFATSAAGIRVAKLKKNGTTDVPGSGVDVSAASAGGTGLGGALSVFLNVADFLELIVQQTSGGALNTAVVAPGQSSLCVQWRSN